MSRGSVLTSKPTKRTGRTISIATKQVTSMMRMQSGDKRGLVSILSTGDLAKYGITNNIPNNMIDLYDSDQLYELVYGGTSDYFQSDVFASHRQVESEFIKDLTREINVQESIYVCQKPNCLYKRIRVVQKQLGGADESMTTIFQCTKCGYEWSNGGRG